MSGLALFRAKFTLPNRAGIELECASGTGGDSRRFVLAGCPVEAVLETQPGKVSSGSMPPMRWLEAGPLFQPFQLREDSDYFIDITLPLTLSAAERHALEDVSWPFRGNLRHVFERDPVKRWRSAGADQCTITGRLRIGSHAGQLELLTPFGGIVAEVVCRKLHYLEEFRSLLEGLAEALTELLLSYDSPVSLTFVDSQQVASNEAALHFQMRYLMSAARLPAAIHDMLRAPHTRLVEEVVSRQLHAIEEPDPGVILESLAAENLTAGGVMAHIFHGMTPTELPDRQLLDSVDTAENRFAKAFLVNLRFVAGTLKERLNRSGKTAAAREAAGWELQLDYLLQAELWKQVAQVDQVSINSQVLMRKQGYRELLRYELALRLALSLPWKEGVDAADTRTGEIRPVDQLYEYWCFLQLHQILSALSERSGGNLVETHSDGLRVRLKRGQQSEVRFAFPSAAAPKLRIALFYNRSFPRPADSRSKWEGSYSASFRPDFSLAITSQGAAGPTHWLHFDAKYRLNWREAQAAFETSPAAESSADAARHSPHERELVRTHKLEDLYKMHAYRDGILGSRGAYVLYPGDVAADTPRARARAIYVRHPSAMPGPPALDFPSVGSFGLNPLNAGNRSELQHFLHGILEEIASGAPYQEETGSFAR